MSKSADHAQTPANSVVRNTTGKGSKQATDGGPGYLPEDKLREICEKYYNQILPIMAEQVHKEKLQGVQTRLTYSERLRREGAKPARRRSPVSTTVFTRLGDRDRNVFTRLGERKKDIHSRLGPEVAPRHRHASERRSAGASRSAEDSSHRKKEARNLIRSYVTCSSERQREIEREWDAADSADRRQPVRTKKPISQKINMTKADNGSPRNKVPKRTRMPTNVKTYDGTRDLEDHIKIFQTSTKIDRWAMPTWCHMFNSTLIGSTRVWFDKLPPESIDSYEMLRKAFLGNFSQQKKYIKGPVEIHHIKQREGDSTKAFMERFKTESMHVNGAPACMRISGFMHDITNPDLIKRLNDNIPKLLDEMMSITTAFLRGEVVVANQSRKKAPQTRKHHKGSHKPSFDKRLDFKNRHKSNKRRDRFTPLTKTPKEILAMETVKFKAPSPMTGLAENRNKNKFCEFHGDKGHNTDASIHLRKQIEEAVKSG
ncbi:reverse transcriptase domain-containing protein [Tanacetum coccineum]